MPIFIGNPPGGTLCCFGGSVGCEDAQEWFDATVTHYDHKSSVI
jgi:hypothetical protein